MLMLLKLILLVLCVHTAHSVVPRVNFSIENLEAFPRVPPKASLDYLVKTNVIDHMEWGCLFNTQQPHHSINKWHDLEINHSEALKDPAFLTGTTFWVNEHMSVGHSMYDIALIQVLASVKVDRVVLQRAPCMNYDLCMGVGTFDSFYKGFYISMFDAFQPGIPIFVRWTWQEKDMKPVYITSKDPINYLEVPQEKVHPNIFLSNVKCFENLIRRNVRCMSCFYPGISADAIQKFKAVAYTMTTPFTPDNVVPPSYFVKDGPIMISFVYRDNYEGHAASRRMENVPFMKDMLLAHYSSNPKIKVRFMNSSNFTRGFQEQMAIMATSHVVITEHGAFQGNMIYLRNGSFIVDLRGSYGHGEYRNFENEARMFGVYYAHVITTGLTSHRDMGFNITEQEVKDVLSLVDQYVTERPFEFNTRDK